MNLWENVLLALAGIRSNMMRALLTMLGIIIGIGSVIGIITVGDALTSSVTSSMQVLGASNIMVALQQKTDETVSMGGMMTSAQAVPTQDDYISEDMIAALRSRYPDEIIAVSYSHGMGSGQVRDGRLYANVTLTGVNEQYDIANSIDMHSGRFLAQPDIAGMRNTCVVSTRLAEKIFGEGDPLGHEIKAYVGTAIHSFTIVGVYEYVESIMTMSFAAEEDIRTDMYIPISTAQRLSGADPGYSMITVVASGEYDGRSVARDVRSFLRRYYENNNNFTVNTISMETIVSEMESVLDTLSIAVAVIAGISLLVGGIGVMNIMLVSVTERTREIGTRKALGATNGNIRVQFIVESMIICFIGGMIGIALGIALGAIGSTLLEAPVSVSLSAIAIAVVFSTSIGLFFGYYPANRAAKMDPIEALRYE